MYFDAHFIFNTFRSRGVFMFVLCLMILCSVRPSFAAEAEATLQAETTDDSAIEAAGIVSEHGQFIIWICSGQKSICLPNSGYKYTQFGLVSGVCKCRYISQTS